MYNSIYAIYIITNFTNIFYIKFVRYLIIISGLIQYKGITFYNPLAITNVFGLLFSAVYQPFSITTLKHLNNSNYFVSQTQTFHINEVEKTINSLPDKLIAGPDMIPNILVKNCFAQLSLSLNIIFTKALNTAFFPNIWKSARLGAVHKLRKAV